MIVSLLHAIQLEELLAEKEVDVENLEDQVKSLETKK